ncbi:WD domain, G-beta repeat [Bremerella volcania]|uniref:WD domain, G-beta repeat n=2 Tax=Bremerella volcania TaxID=2527984 RepID=A0A518C9L8_9BACT|nr:WD domain, G-beta repeat [Bremerella volcania]
MIRLLRAWFSVLVVVIAPLPLTVAQEMLPAESILPGQDEPPKFSHEGLPDESVVPGLPVNSMQAEQPAPEQLSPSDEVPLAGEHVVPNIEVVQEVALPEDPPWLRLNLGGPTAPVQTLCFSRDGTRLLAAGNDKMVHSWIAAAPQPGMPQRWIYETPVRWQVQRATRGDIHALAAMQGKFAFAGIGASALTGEIVLADQGRMAYERTLFDVENGPRSQILDLAALPEGLFSLDSEGDIQYWSADPATGKWSFATGANPNETLKTDPAQLRSWRLRGSRMASSGDDTLIFPVPVRSEQGIPYWRIGRWKANDAGATLVGAITQEFPGGIGAMACSANGSRLAAADISDSGTLVLADLANPRGTASIATGANVRSVCMPNDGSQVAAVIAKSPRGPFEIRLWKWPLGGAPQASSTLPLATIATDAAFSPDGRFLAVTQENAVVMHDLADLKSPVVLTTPIITPEDVAFTLDADYRIVIRQQAADGQPESVIQFETARRRYSVLQPPPPTVPSNPWKGTWSLQQKAVDRGTRLVYEIFQGDQSYCEIPQAILGTSRITSVCWLAPEEGRNAPSHIVVGTVGRNHAYLLDITNPQNVSVVREFRGHSSAIRSVGVSIDYRYLVTGSDDGLVNIWKLTEEPAASRSQNAWGADFEIVNNQVVARNVIADGPLYYRGVRTGDVIESLAQRVDANPDAPFDEKERDEKTIDNADAIVQTLATTAGDTMLRFQIERNGARQKPFYLHPAWQPLASLVTTSDREWAYWTPYGYYDASFNGHKIFGWQINRGIDQAPDFFLAAELKQQLEKPRVMERLLDAGSLSAAMQVAKATVPFNLHNRLEALASLRPQITIDSPTNDQLLNESQVLVEATIHVPAGSELTSSKVFANGVPAVEKLDEEVTVSEVVNGHQHKLRWRVALPPDQRIRLDVIASTTEGISATESLTIVQPASKHAARPRLFVIAAGISQYSDQQIPQLDFAAENAKAFTNTLKAHAAQMDVETIVLTDANVTQPLWNVAADTMWQQLQNTARPQDVVLFFLSGHGVRDVESQRYFFLTSDSRFADVAGRRYERCISSDAFQAYFAGLPCRKVAILDTCHSGAIQPLRQDDLKVMLRDMEEDVILTITASEGDEEAFEERDKRLGRFTARLVEGLSGSADQRAYAGNGDGQVSLNEVAQYVQATVPSDAAAVGQSQHPTIFPRDLFPLVDVPLATSAAN